MGVKFCHYLQTKTGAQAQGCTAFEFQNAVMPTAHYRALVSGIQDPIFAFDNNRIHNDVKKHPEVLGLTRDNFLDLPKYSPDFNKPIEHNHGYIEKRFKQLLRDYPYDLPLSATQLMEMLMRVFMEYTPVQGVHNDVNSLRATWQAVIDVGGDYPAKEYM